MNRWKQVSAFLAGLMMAAQNILPAQAAENPSVYTPSDQTEYTFYNDEEPAVSVTEESEDSLVNAEDAYTWTLSDSDSVLTVEPIEDDFILPDQPAGMSSQAARNSRTKVKTLILKNTAVIGSYFFADMPLLETVLFDDCLEEIHEFAFADCPSLKEFDLGDHVRLEEQAVPDAVNPAILAQKAKEERDTQYEAELPLLASEVRDENNDVLESKEQYFTLDDKADGADLDMDADMDRAVDDETGPDHEAGLDDETDLDQDANEDDEADLNQDTDMLSTFSAEALMKDAADIVSLEIAPFRMNRSTMPADLSESEGEEEEASLETAQAYSETDDADLEALDDTDSGSYVDGIDDIDNTDDTDDTGDADGSDEDQNDDSHTGIIKTISVRWLDEDGELLTIDAMEAGYVSARLRVDYQLESEESMEPGDVVLLVPADIFRQRSSGEPDGIVEYEGVMGLPVPEAPVDRDYFNFQYLPDSNEYMLTSVKPLPAGTSGYFEFSYDKIDPANIQNGSYSDWFTATMEIYKDGQQADSQTTQQIRAQINTRAYIKNAEKRGTKYTYVPAAWSNTGLFENYEDLLPPITGGYLYVDWYTYAYAGGTQPYSVSILDRPVPEDGGIVIGSSFAEYSADNSGIYEKENIYSGYKEPGYSFYQHMYIAYPKAMFEDKNGRVVKNTVTYSMTGKDDVPGEIYDDRQASVTGSIHHRSLNFPPTPGSRDEHLQAYKYGFDYPIALNELKQDRPVDIEYRIDNRSLAFFSTKREDIDYSEATLEDYGKVNVYTDVQDDSLISFPETTRQHLGINDYRILKIRMPEKPVMYTYTQKSDGSWGYVADASKPVPAIAIYAAADPQEDSLDEYVKMGTFQWNGGTCTITPAENSDAVAGSDGRSLILPEGYTRWRYVLYTKEAGITFNIYPVYRINPSEQMKDFIEAVQDTSAEIQIENDIHMDYWRGNVAEGESAEELFAQPTHARSQTRLGELSQIMPIHEERYGATDQLKTASQAVRLRTSGEQINSDYDNGQIRIAFSGTVYEQSTMQSVRDYNNLIENNTIPMDHGGKFWNLLPEKVECLPETVTSTLPGMHVTGIVLHRNWRNSGRTMMEITVSRPESTPVYIDDQAGLLEGGYGETFGISFEGIYSLRDFKDRGNPGVNTIVYESFEDSIGTVPGLKGEKNTPIAKDIEKGYDNNRYTKDMNEQDKDLVSQINPETEYNNPSWLYGSCTPKLKANLADNIGPEKTVSALHSGQFNTSAQVPTGGDYTYKLRFVNGNEAKSDIILFDQLEAETSTKWKGYLKSIDLSTLKSMGINPVVYVAYSENQDLINQFFDPFNKVAAITGKPDPSVLAGVEIPDLTASGIFWSRGIPNPDDIDSWKKIRAIAIDCSQRQDGSKFILPKEKTLSVDLEMMAPSITEEGIRDLIHQETPALAVNRMFTTSFTTLDLPGNPEAEDPNPDSTGNAESEDQNLDSAGNTESEDPNPDSLLREKFNVNPSSTTSVKLTPFKLYVKKQWRDNENQDGKRPDNITLELKKNGASLNPPQKIDLNEENSWTSYWEELDWGDTATFEPIDYRADEEPVEGYTFSSYMTETLMPAEEGKEAERVSLIQAINDHQPEKIRISGEKKWEDVGYESNRPSSVQIELYQDGRLYQTQTIEEEIGTWTYDFGNLDRYKNVELSDGTHQIREIHWEVREKYIEGYVPRYENCAVTDAQTDAESMRNGKITNVYDPYTNLSLTKKATGQNSEKTKHQVFTFEFILMNPDGITYNPNSYDYYIENVKTQNRRESGKIANGKSIDLEADERIVIQHIESQCMYAFKEAKVPGYSQSSATDLSGILRAGIPSSAVVVNDYKASGSIELQAVKDLEGQDLARNAFLFELQEKKGSEWKTLYTATNTKKNEDGTGAVIFPSIKYSQDDIGTKQYRICEHNDGKSYYTYDEHICLVNVTITDDGKGHIHAAAEYLDENQQDIVNRMLNAAGSFLSNSSEAVPANVFHNEYTASGELELKAHKILEGAELKAGMFKFEVLEAGSAASEEDEDQQAGENLQQNSVTPRVIARGTNDASGLVTFTPIKYSQDDIGKTFKYTVKEIPDLSTEYTETGGDTLSSEQIVYDKGIAEVTAKVSDNKDGTLSVMVTVDSDDESKKQLLWKNTAADGALVIQKHVQASEGQELTEEDLKATFDFEVSLQLPDGSKPDFYSLDYELTEADEDPAASVIVPSANGEESVVDDADFNGSEEADRNENQTEAQQESAVLSDASMIHDETAVSSDIEANQPVLYSAGFRNLSSIVSNTVHSALATSAEQPENTADAKNSSSAFYTADTNIKNTRDNTPVEDTVFTRPSVPADFQGALDGNWKCSELIPAIPEGEVPDKQHTGTWFNARWSLYSNNTLLVLEVQDDLEIQTYQDEDFHGEKDSMIVPWFNYISSIKYVNTIVKGSKKLDLTSITSLHRLFRKYTNLEAANLKGWDTSTICNFWDIFDSDTKLKAADLTGWDFSQAETMRSMFNGARVSHVILNDVNAPKLNSLVNVFYGNPLLYTIQMKNWTVSNQFGTHQMFYSNTGLQHVDMSNWTFSDQNGRMRDQEYVTLHSTSAVTLHSMYRMFWECNQLKSANFGEWTPTEITTMQEMFKNCRNLEEVNWTMSENYPPLKVTNMFRMFMNDSLPSQTFDLDLSGWNTVNLTNTMKMFCRSGARTINLDNWNVSKLKIFGDNLEIENTLQENLANGIFSHAEKTKSISLKNWGPASATKMQYLFLSCTSLEEIDLSGWNLPELTDCLQMMKDCTSLKKVNLSGWNTPKLTTITEAFEGCTSLEEVDLSGWNVKKVTEAKNLFASCSRLASVNLHGWEMKNGITTGDEGMFSGDSSVQTMYLDDSYFTNNLPITGIMPNIGGKTWISADGRFGPWTNAELKENIQSYMSGWWILYNEGAMILSFDLNGALGSMPPILIDTTREDQSLPDYEPILFEHVFKGWYTNTQGLGKELKPGQLLSQDILNTLLDAASPGSGSGTPVKTVTLYANWRKQEAGSAPGEHGIYTITVGANQKAVITSKLPGGTTYTVTEKPKAGWVMEAHVNDSGKIIPLKENETVSSRNIVHFTNIKRDNEATVTPFGTKLLSNAAPDDGAFAFGLYDAKTNLLQTVLNTGAAFKFEPQTIQHDLFVEHPEIEQHHVFYIREITSTDQNAGNANISLDQNVTYDTTIYKKEYTTIFQNEQLQIQEGSLQKIAAGQPEYTNAETAEIAFNNEWKTQSLTLNKVVSDLQNALSVGAHTFNFTVTFEDAVHQPLRKTVMVNGESVSLVNGTVDIPVTVNYDGAGSVAKSGSAVISGIPAGTTYQVEETGVSREPYNGYWLETDAECMSGTIEPAEPSTVTVTNSYQSSGSLSLQASKKLVNGTLEEDQFRFVLEEYTAASTTEPIEAQNPADPAEEPRSESFPHDIHAENGESTVMNGVWKHLKTVANNAEGKILFPLSYTKPGVYLYRIRENIGDDSDIVYDQNPYYVRVNVTDNGRGELNAVATYYRTEKAQQDNDSQTFNWQQVDKENVQFVNTRKTGSVSLTKTVKNATKAQSSMKFNFAVTLKDSEGNALDQAFDYSISSIPETGTDGVNTETRTIKNGGQFPLTDGQMITITALPTGTNVTFEELAMPRGFTLQEGCDLNAVIQTDQTISLEAVNIYTARASVTPHAHKIFKNGVLGDSDDSSFLFNFYDVSSSADLEIKNLLDSLASLQNSESEVVFPTSIPEDAVVKLQGRSKSSGDIDFGELVYTAVDLNGEDSRTWTYLVQEVNDQKRLVEYDTSIKIYQVTATNKGAGNLDVSGKWMVQEPEVSSGIPGVRNLQSEVDTSQEAVFINIQKTGIMPSAGTSWTQLLMYCASLAVLGILGIVLLRKYRTV